MLGIKFSMSRPRSLNRTTTEPRPYQVTGAEFLRDKKRAMLADQMGVGKSLTAVLAAEAPVLVACPTYLTTQWGDVLEHERPHDSVSVAYGERAKREEAIAARADWTIINIEMFRTYTLPTNFYKTLIVDESHYLRGRNAMQSRKASIFGRTVPNVFLLTGTPIIKEADDLWHQLHILDHKGFSSYWRFVETYLKTVTDQFSTRVVGVAYPALLAHTLNRYALRRTYADVGLYLPSLISRDVSVRPDAKWIAAYDKTKKTYRKEDITLESAGAILSALRSMTASCPAKLDALKGILDDSGGETGAVVFCWYRESAANVGKLLGWPVIDGSIAPEKRAGIAKGNKNVVATLASLAEGVDLSEKKLVIFYEVDHSPGKIEQALARLRRFSAHANAAEPVRAHFLMVRKSIDESVYRCVLRRVSDVRKILAAELA